MKLIKSTTFASLIILLSLLSSLVCLFFLNMDIASALLLCSTIIFIIFLMINKNYKNWKFILINIILLGATSSVFKIYKTLDQATLRMYQPYTNIKSGDIIFQTSTSSQSNAIQTATNSKYSHMGIIYLEDNQYFVYEASSIVKLTPLNEWINNGLDGRFVVKRVKDSEKILTADVLKEMRNIGLKFKGKPYDKYFEWSDDKIYCSELVWKIYNQATHIEIGSLDKLADFDLSSKEVINQLNERYKGKIPYQEIVISPDKMFNSDRLYTIEEN